MTARKTAHLRGKNRKRGRSAGGPGTIRVGTASWTDPGFVADWYPVDLPARERLVWYAEHFNLVEVNSTFYALPQQKTVARWAEQTPDSFVFGVKLHKLLSRHSTSPDLLPKDLRPWTVLDKARVHLTPTIESAVTKRFLEIVEPLRDSGKLGALLLQLSPAFGTRHHSLKELDHVVELTRGYRLAVELRNRDWFSEERLDETLAYFRQRRVTMVSVDALRSEHFTVVPAVDTVTNPRLAYLRAHGRNARGYITGRNVAERFDYDYSIKELHEIADRAAEMAEVAGTTHIIFNNNKSDYAPRAAARFRRMVDARDAAINT
jgi:uncharacterized protein YecE (DUF72 family)